MIWFPIFIEWTSAAAQPVHAGEVPFQCCQFCKPHSESIATSSPFFDVLHGNNLGPICEIQWLGLELSWNRRPKQRSSSLYRKGFYQAIEVPARRRRLAWTPHPYKGVGKGRRHAWTFACHERPLWGWRVHARHILRFLKIVAQICLLS